jgi:hypothetical protein
LAEVIVTGVLLQPVKLNKVLAIKIPKTADKASLFAYFKKNLDPVNCI